MSKPQVLMQMWKPYREFLIQQHRFYVNEASTRLMSQFDNINADADKAAEAWLERRGELFDPDRDDEGAIYEEAESVAIESIGSWMKCGSKPGSASWPGCSILGKKTSKNG